MNKVQELKEKFKAHKKEIKTSIIAVGTIIGSGVILRAVYNRGTVVGAGEIVRAIYIDRQTVELFTDLVFENSEANTQDIHNCAMNTIKAMNQFINENI